MARGMSERPARMDPSTGLTRPGQTIDQSPASGYQVPGNSSGQAPTPRLGQGAYVTGYGEPGGPMQEQYGAPSAPGGPGAVTAPTGGSLTTGHDGAPLPSGNSPGDFTPQMGDSAASAGERVRDRVRSIARGNGGRPADLG